MRKIVLLFIYLFIVFSGGTYVCFAGDWMFTGHADISLENEPVIGGIAIIKIKAIVTFDETNARISCRLPEGLEFINDNNYKVKHIQRDTSKEGSNLITLYEGTMKRYEPKEILFKVRVLDTKKYTIFGGVTGAVRKRLEINLGDPEPPEWNPEVAQEIKIVPKDEIGGIGIRARAGVEKAEELLDLRLSKETPPPLRSEFRIRTKNNPSIEYWNLKHEHSQPLTIPLRYLVYSEEESPKVEVNLFLPEGIELVNDADYQISQEQGKTKVLLYSGPIHVKECKAFYLKVQPKANERYSLLVQTYLTNLQNEELLKENRVSIDLVPGKRY